MKESPKNIITIRHFKELDDISSGKRDGELVNDNESVKNYALELNRSLIYEGFSGVMFISSDKKRSEQTAQLIKEELLKINPKIKSILKIDSRLNSLDEGKIILPEQYKKGDFLSEIDTASKIFIRETHATDYGKEKDNPDYKYGDPVILPNGEYKYPELVNRFEELGESYSKYISRVYSLIIDSTEKADEFQRKVKIVIVTHAQTYQIIKSLLIIIDKVKKEGLKTEPGNLSLLCCKDFLERRKEKTAISDWEEKPVNLIKIDPEILKEPVLLETLKKEIEYLKK